MTHAGLVGAIFVICDGTHLVWRDISASIHAINGGLGDYHVVGILLMMRRAVALLSGDGVTGLLARGSVVSFLIQGIGAILIFLSEILLARVLGAEGYGLFATVAAWLQILVVLVLLGSNHLLLRFVPVYVASSEWGLLRGLISYCMRFSLALGGGLVLTSWFSLVTAGTMLSDETRSAFGIGLTVLPLAALSLQRQAVLRGLHRISSALVPEFVIRPVALMAMVAMTVWVANSGVSAAGALFLNGIALMIAFLIGWHWQQRALPCAAKTAKQDVRRHQWLKIAVPMFLVSGMQLLIVRLDIVFLSILTGHFEAGRYAAASRVADIIVFALASANVVVAPLIAGLHARGEIAALQAMLTSLAKGVLFLTIPLVGVIVLLGEEILGLFGQDYVVGYTALLILTFGQVVNALSGPVDFVMSMTGHQKKMLQILAGATLLHTFLGLLLIPAFGLIGAAAATACTTVYWNLAMRRSMIRKLGVDGSIWVLLRGRARAPQ